MKHEDLPKYLQIKYKIEELFNTGQIKPGDKLPAEHKLAGRYEVSRHTVRKALNMLKQEGLLAKKQGVGTFRKINRKKKTNIIGFISISLYDYIFADILHGVDHILHENGYQILLGNSKDNQTREQNILEEFLKKNIDGLIIEPAQSASDYSNLTFLEQFVDKQIPVVILDSKFANSKFHYITVDDKKGGYLAASYLIDIGHQMIAIIYKALHKPAIKRFQGYKQALRERQIPLDNRYIREYYKSEFETPEKFRKEIETLTYDLMNTSPAPTAIFCFNDQIAILVTEILQDLNYQVPEDVSIIGFDDSNLVKLNNISISSIGHPQEEAGKRAADIIIKSIKKEDYSCQNIIFRPELVKRDSVRSI